MVSDAVRTKYERQRGKSRRWPPEAVDQRALAAQAAFGHRPRLIDGAGRGFRGQVRFGRKATYATTGRVENETLMRVGRSMHGLWRKAVRTR